MHMFPIIKHQCLSEVIRYITKLPMLQDTLYKFGDLTQHPNRVRTTDSGDLEGVAWATSDDAAGRGVAALGLRVLYPGSGKVGVCDGLWDPCGSGLELLRP
ncbi:hypothetical protein HPB50_017741 [Hyalomma asiaticum]|uniref:Uncharacterized protein n=1 Tax=Hyalomma asiaticum TaxID=266040 RepID=A0ACB7SZR7_HYAAI|nr:hypothetical protein HPB50_017741 [Hyalomma asiaticum]